MGGACGMCVGGAYRISVGKPEGINLEDLVADRRVILKWIFKKWDWK